MGRNPKKTLFLLQQFTAFDHFADTIRGWDLDFKQLDRGSFCAELTQVETDALLVTHGLFNRRLEQLGGIPPGSWTFGILEPFSPEIIWHGEVVSDQMIMVHPPGFEIDATTPPGFHVLTVSVSMDVIADWNELNQRDGGLGLRLTGGVIRVESSKLVKIRRAANRLATYAETDTPLIPELSRDVQSNILEALPVAVYNQPRPSAQKRSRALIILKDYIEAHLGGQITLTDLCTVSKSSPRTIQRLFKNRFGATPKAYIQARRLNHVHRELSTARYYGKKVSDIANRWGFWHMGQFASDYRQFFGELPSETLAKANR